MNRNSGFFYLEASKYLKKYWSYKKMSLIKTFYFLGEKATAQKFTTHPEERSGGGGGTLKFQMGTFIFIWYSNSSLEST